jgi:hypothetical protein
MSAHATSPRPNEDGALLGLPGPLAAGPGRSGVRATSSTYDEGGHHAGAE